MCSVKSVFYLSVLQDSKKKGRRREDVGKRSREKLGKETTSLTDVPQGSVSPQPPSVVAEDVYTRLLHKKASLLIIVQFLF